MATQQAWGSVTAKTKGASDPNVLPLKEANRVRLLQPAAVKWRQHGIEGGADPEGFRSCVCPKGPDGTGQAPCPLCMKPTDEQGEQRFPISKRYATNVWDYESNSVKVLIAGKQIFEEFDAVAMMGMDPTQTDFLIHKVGTGRSTSYKVVRGDAAPLSQPVTDDMLHDLDKYGEPDSSEKIFEILEEAGIDWEALELPSYTLDAAEAMQMPYGKHKGMTLEQLYANDRDYMLYIYNSKREQGNYGDAIFIAMHAILLHYGDVEPLDELPSAPPRSNGHVNASATEMVTLIAPDGTEAEVPAAAKDPLLAAGYTLKPEPAPEPEPAPANDAGYVVIDGNVTLTGPDGSEVTVPEAAVAGLLAAGFTPVSWGDAPVDVEPADDEEVTVDISGTQATMLYGQAKPLIASGTATLVQAAAPAQPQYQLPGDEDEVQFYLNVVSKEVPMAFKDARRLAAEGQGRLVDEQLAAAVAADKADDRQIAQDLGNSAPDAGAATPPPSGDALDPNLATQREDGRWVHPALPGKDYATKGPVTQALNKLRNTAPAAPAGAPTPAQGGGEGKEAKMQACRDLLAQMPTIQSDFQQLVKVFEEVSGGKRVITDFTEEDLDKLEAKLTEMLNTQT